MGLLQSEERGRLLYILADGLLREEVPEGTDGAKLRIVKDDDGNVKAQKWELTYPGITGFISGVVRRDGDYGTSVLVSFKDENEEEFTVAIQAKSKYGEDFIHKLPNIDLTKELTFKPYSFKDGERDMKGITLTQDGNKVTNAYNYKDDEGKWQSVDGYPQVDENKKPKTSELWQVFFTTRREWVMEDLIAKGLMTEASAAAEVDF